MSDEKMPDRDAMRAPPRTSNRGPRREPPVIEGEAIRPVDPAPAPEAPPVEASGTVTPPVESTTSEPAPVETQAGETLAGEPPAAESALDRETASLSAVSSDDLTGPRPADPSVDAPDGNPPPPAAPARGYGLGAVAAASLGSAALAALAVFGVQMASTPDTAPIAALDKRIAQVEQSQAAPREQVSPAALGALEKRVASVEAIAAGAAEAARKAADAAARQPASSASGAAQPAAGAAQQALAAMDAKLATLDKNATGAVSALQARLDAVEKALAAPKSDDRLTESRAEAAPPPDLDPLRKQIAAIEARLQTMEKQAAPLAEAARAMEGRFKGLEERIQPLAGRIDESRTQSEAERKRSEALAEGSADAARVSLAQSIGAAIEAGAPFAAQVDALARLGAPAERLAPLREPSQKGVPTVRELARAFAALEPAIVTRTENAGASVVDRLTSSAMGLVRVRPVGEPGGDAPANIFARMSRALERGDVAGALKDWDKLPDAAKAASAQWAQQARTRVGAEEAARAILSDSTQKLGRS